MIWSLFSLSALAALCHLSQGERQGDVPTVHRYAQDAFSLLEHREPGCGAALAACPLHKYFRSIPNKKRTMTQLQSLRLQLPSDTAMSDSSGTLTQNRECQGTPNHEAMFMKSAPAQGARGLSRSAFRLSVTAAELLFQENEKSRSELPGQRREVPKMENGNALSDISIIETAGNVNPEKSRPAI